MLGNLAVIMLVIAGFWFNFSNLIDSLWTLLFLTPVTLFIFSKGLGAKANCDV